MRFPRTVRIAAVLGCVAAAFDCASAQIVKMEEARHYFQQLGRLAGTLDACGFQECKKARDVFECDVPWRPLTASHFISLKTEEELKACGATSGQISELLGVFGAETRTYQNFACPMTIAEAREKYQAILRAIDERKRTGTTCVRGY
jgi:hypothetical protein